MCTIFCWLTDFHGLYLGEIFPFRSMKNTTIYQPVYTVYEGNIQSSSKQNRDLAVCMFSEEALSWLLRCFFLEIMKPTPVTTETIKNRFFFIALLLMSGTLLSYERMEAESAV